MAITFGSFGDIIAAVQVVYKLIEVLNSQRGVKREFGDLLVDLRLFHRYLEQVRSPERMLVMILGPTECSFSRSGKHAKKILVLKVSSMFCSRPFPIQKER
jgi:hypothetical protein